MTNLNLPQTASSQRQTANPRRSACSSALCRRAARRIGSQFASATILRGLFLFISITLLSANPTHLAAQQVTTVAPPPAAEPTASAEPAASPLPDAPDTQHYPDAVPIPPPGSAVHIESDTQAASSAGLDILDGKVILTYRDRTLQADHMEYDADTGDVTLTGHIALTLLESDEHIEASRGSFNIRTGLARFYDVTGSVGLHQKIFGGGPATTTSHAVYANGNPFLFTGKLVVRTGPRQLQIYNGTVTSCQLPHPDWLLSGAKFSVDGNKARAANSVFHVLGLPLLWLPYVTHPVDTSDRQSGILIPEIGFNSSAKGNTIGEQVYWAVNRSTDITVGTIYYSARGWEQSATLRYRGPGEDFVKAHYSGLQDRGYYPGGVYVNQSGTDVVFSGRHDLFTDPAASADAKPSPIQAPIQGRMVADLEYLSSFPYREAFSSNFNQAVSSDVVSTIYVTRQSNGNALSLEGDRYQGEKRVESTNAITGVIIPEEQVHIFHAPALEFTTTDHRLGNTLLDWNLDSSLAALKRTQPNFETSGMIERLDLHPELALPFGGGGWRVRPSIAGRETFYSRSRLPSIAGVPGPPVENTATLNRADIDLQFDVRPPLVERTFTSGFIRNLLRHDMRHTIEPDIIYRYTAGIDNFADALRFDMVDVASDTNELEYGATQRLFLRRAAVQPCRPSGSSADATEIFKSAGQDSDSSADPAQAAGWVDSIPAQCGSREWISWRVAQKYFFDPTFGGAVVENGPRSVLETTLNFSGISFLTGPRTISPIISRLRVRTSDKTDVEWDFDYDTCSSSVSATTSTNKTLPCQRKFTANNVYLDLHQGSFTGGIVYARLNAPARSIVDGVPSSVADFDQMRVNFGYGAATRPGFSALATAGIDIDLGTVQYGSLLASYNWNCCGVTVEYRKYELGTARNDNGYKFNFTLANIGSAGNIHRSGQPF
ncbi:MAG TPA: LPS assembly protein LptD [Acidobacteriaceae bacterium]|nr:LPS assembly protein LptD [Acidobacteriaceae bacterium]